MDLRSFRSKDFGSGLPLIGGPVLELLFAGVVVDLELRSGSKCQVIVSSGVWWNLGILGLNFFQDSIANGISNMLFRRI